MAVRQMAHHLHRLPLYESLKVRMIRCSVTLRATQRDANGFSVGLHERAGSLADGLERAGEQLDAGEITAATLDEKLNKIFEKLEKVGA